MADISTVQANRHKEAETVRHNEDMKRLRTKSARAYNKEVKHYETVMSEMRKDYEQKISRLENELEQNLVKSRNQQKKVMATEHKRLNEELNVIKQAHEDRVAELKVTQMNQLDEIRRSHESTLANAREKFMKEKLKWEA